ncbi:MAG: carotenoid 1,2-hydratase [Granulosicoccus sp.]
MSVPSFTDPVPDNGYRWWYLDAVSDDDQHAITVIIFIGSVFSPYYARARKRNKGIASAHCAVNVALYGAPWRWCMTERTAASMRASEHQLSIGKSFARLDEGKLRVQIDEMAVPLPSRVRGELVIDLPDYDLAAHPLDSEKTAEAQHFWQPIAPQTRIDVAFEQPSLAWQGSAYVDSNSGAVSLESSFKSWVWSRSHASDNTTTILYDVIDRQGVCSKRSFRYAADGTMTPYEAQQVHELPKTRYWRFPRTVRTRKDSSIGNIQTLEDTPFYSRSRFVEQHRDDKQFTVHESLSLDRFDSTWVRCLLPFRMPRSTRPILLD